MNVAIIPARSGSKRLLNKNKKNFCGQPIIAWVIQTAKSIGLFDRIIVSTDDVEIVSIASQFGAEAPFLRPDYLCDDFTGTDQVVKHALKWLVGNQIEVEYVCCIYPTAVLTTGGDLLRGFALLQANDDCSVIAVQQYVHPIVRGLLIDKDGHIVRINPDKFSTRTQDCEISYYDAGQFYWMPRQVALDGITGNFKSLPLMLGKHQTIDIDDADDWAAAEAKFLTLNKTSINPNSISKVAGLKPENCRISLGTVQFGQHYGIANTVGQVSQSEASAILRIASIRGISTIDTAIDYGSSERCLGAAGVEKFDVVTKLPDVPTGCTDISGWINEQVAASFTRLGLTTIYGLLIHHSEQLTGQNGKTLWHTLQDLKNRRLVEKVGFSIYTPNELSRVVKLFHPDLVQVPFSVFDQRMLNTGWLRRLKQEGVEIHTRSTFLQGLLLLKNSVRPVKFAPWTNLFTRWHQWIEAHNLSPLQACLAHSLAVRDIDRVIVGVDDLSQLMQIVDSIGTILPNDFPDFHSDDERLINPALWKTL